MNPRDRWPNESDADYRIRQRDVDIMYQLVLQCFEAWCQKKRKKKKAA